MWQISPIYSQKTPGGYSVGRVKFFRESCYGTKIQPIQSALYMTAYKSAYKSADSYHSQQTTEGLISVKTLKSTCFNALINAWSLLGGINQTFLSCTSLILFQSQQINWSKWQTGSQRCDIVPMWLESQFNCVYFSWVNLKYFITIHCIIISFYLFKLVHILLLLHLILFQNIPLHIFLFISFKLFYFTPSVICFCGGFLILISFIFILFCKFEILL